MNEIYPYSSPIILNDNIFTQYGGLTGSFSHAQLQGAYQASEQLVSKYIGTFLLPTIVTGTYPYEEYKRFIATDYGYVSQILSATLLLIQSSFTCNLAQQQGCTFIWDDTYGYIHFSMAMASCGCSIGIGSYPMRPYQFQLAYVAGLPTGIATLPLMLQALTVEAGILLNEMSFPTANEGVGNVGITEFKTLDYSEKRKAWKNTVLGQSPKSAFVAMLIDGCVRKCRRSLVL